MIRRLIAEIGRFFKWWGDELAACLPRRLRSALKPPEQSLRIEVGRSWAVFSLRKGDTRRSIGRVEFRPEAPGASRDQVRQLLRSDNVSFGPVVIDLQAGKALQPTIKLPLAAAESLKDVLAFEMDRHTPFKADNVYYDFRVLSADTEQQRLSVEMLVAPRDDVHRAVDIVRTWGFEPERVASASASTGRRNYNLLPDSQLKPRGRAMQRLSAAAAVAVIALLAVAVYLPLEQAKAELETAERKLDKVRVVAEKANSLKDQVANLLARNSFVVDEKRRIPTAVEILDEITRTLPDDTWLLQLVFRGGTLRISGYSENPSALIRLLEQSALLTEVRFSSPVTMDPRLGRERFNIITVISDKEAT